MPRAPSTLSLVEVLSVQQSLADHGVRWDGRHLLQHRPLIIGGEEAMHGSTRLLPQENQFTSSSSCVRLDTTVVTAVASARVIELDDDDDDDSEHGSGSGGETTTNREGQLHISLHAPRHIRQQYLEAYQGSGSGGSRRADRQFFAMAALTMREVYGAERVTVLNTTLAEGVAEATAAGASGSGAVGEDNAEEEGNKAMEDDILHHSVKGKNDTEETRRGRQQTRRQPSAAAGHTGFPAAQLYIGKGFAFEIHVHVTILEAGGGNMLTAVSAAVLAALRKARLPHVTLHDTSSGVSVEVDSSRPYAKPVDFSQLPQLIVLGISPTRHYVLDPTWEEELAMPQQLHIATNPSGQLMYSRFQQMPSRRGARRLERRGANTEEAKRQQLKRQREEDGGNEDDEGQAVEEGLCGGTIVTAPMESAAFAMGRVDLMGVITDAIHASTQLHSSYD